MVINMVLVQFLSFFNMFVMITFALPMTVPFLEYEYFFFLNYYNSQTYMWLLHHEQMTEIFNQRERTPSGRA
jgi:hypothetical protein